MQKSGRSAMKRFTKARIAVVVAVTFLLPLVPDTSAPGLSPMTRKAQVVGGMSSSGPIASLREFQPPLSDQALAALTVYLEAGAESFAGKLAVAAVIRNRMRHRYQSDGTVRGTVLKPWQFQPWNTRSPSQLTLDLKKKSMRDSLLAWHLVQDGREIVDGAVLFYNPKLAKTPDWAKVSREVVTIGGHTFYVPPKRQA